MEDQKSGIDKKDLKTFIKCVNDLGLNVIGLMCIPPNDGKEKTYFKEMSELSRLIGLKELSMGMSSDYSEAIECGATFLRIGSKIFGNRS